MGPVIPVLTGGYFLAEPFFDFFELEPEVMDLVFHLGFEKGVEAYAAFLSFGDSVYLFLDAFFAGEDSFAFFCRVYVGTVSWGVDVLTVETEYFSSDLSF